MFLPFVANGAATSRKCVIMALATILAKFLAAASTETLGPAPLPNLLNAPTVSPYTSMQAALVRQLILQADGIVTLVRGL
ncbi:hypothetical protein BGZ96_008495 [Linnemannia gamsii]|uniref:Secreted protein n=1 Tax=Linnemannia gamsii TaxID=64522 RepID=A0ABQ7JY78_9FUNG|nr:hypothetical protein BGZ96_008495 [Linnemannia gamsii]